MGLFDKIAKKLTSSAIENIVKTVTDNVNQAVGNNKDETPASDVQTAPVRSTVEKADVKAYFAEILASEFGQYQIRENVSLSEFGAQGRPYDFGLLQNGQFAAVVVLAGHNKTRNHPYWNSEKKAQELNIPFINFYTHMPNERGFVINRINRLIRR